MKNPAPRPPRTRRYQVTRYGRSLLICALAERIVKQRNRIREAEKMAIADQIASYP
jgi:hypothetical protein